VIFLPFFVLSVFGLFLLLDITASSDSLMFITNQLKWSLLSLVALVFAMSVDLVYLKKYIMLFLLVIIVLLVLVLLVGPEINGAKRSIRFGGITFQPSLLAMVFLIFYYAKKLEEKQEVLHLSKPSVFIKNLSHLVIVPGIIYVLILVGRHLSVLIISSATLFSLLYYVKIPLRTLIISLLIVVTAAFSVISFGAEYRSGRVSIFKKYSLVYKLLSGDKPNEEQIEDKAQKKEEIAAKEKEPKKKFDDLQVRESLTALSSGYVFGKGTAGGRAKFRFLPEARTDYIFSIIGEQFGFLGAFVIVILYSVLFLRGVSVTYKSNSFYLSIVMLGLTLNIFLHFLVNMGVAMSALPSTGVTLPFISYGGTSFIFNTFAIGLMINISARKHTFN